MSFDKTVSFQLHQLTDQLEKLRPLETELQQTKLSQEQSARELRAAEEQVQKSKSLCEELESKSKSLETSLLTVEADKTVLMGRTAQLKEELDSKDKMTATLQQKMKEEVEAKEKAHTELSELKNSTDLLKAELNAVKDQLNFSEKREEESKSCIEQTKQELTLKIQESVSLQEQLGAAQLELNETKQSLGKRLELAEKNSADLNEQLELRKAELDELKKEKKELDRRVSELTEQKETLTREKEDADSQLKVR